MKYYKILAVSFIELLAVMAILAILLQQSLNIFRELRQTNARKEAIAELIKLQANILQIALSSNNNPTTKTTLAVAKELINQNYSLDTPNKLYRITLSATEKDYTLIATTLDPNKKDPLCSEISLKINTEAEETKAPAACWE